MIPEDLYYSEEHEWVRLDDDVATIGITDYVLPLFERNLFVVTGDSVVDDADDWPKLVWILDKRDETNPMPIATCPLPYDAFARKGERIGATIFTRTCRLPRRGIRKIVIGTFFNGGLRAYDISNPYQPKEVGNLRAAGAGARAAWHDPAQRCVRRRAAGSSTRSTGTSAGCTSSKWISNAALPSPNIGRFGRRQRHARAHRIPVTVVTGFLGAGKTTLVRRFLETPAGRSTAVIVNEFGAIGIDDALLRSSADETVLLGNGCLCCNVRSDLQLALRRLVADRDAAKIPQFVRVVIETSGLADPARSCAPSRPIARSAKSFTSRPC